MEKHVNINVFPFQIAPESDDATRRQEEGARWCFCVLGPEEDPCWEGEQH